MKDEISVRQATRNDIDIIVRFNSEMAHETENIILSQQILTKGVTAVFDDSAKGFYIVAECDGTVVGQAMITYEWSDWRNAIVWWIQSVYILPDYRKSGVFRSIFEQIKSLAKESNACGLRLYVDRSNIIAKKAYKNLGMEESHYDLYEMMIK
jgi:N-acetylglutamate synthase-like GNAT family acetyltransferase